MAVPVVFDLDGTLIDSAPDIHAAVARMLEAEGMEPLPLAEVRGFIGNGVAVLVER
ncbi:MAG: HAD hydrolase-like protein, partial [Albidovulum sp.]